MELRRIAGAIRAGQFCQRFNGILTAFTENEQIIFLPNFNKLFDHQSLIIILQCFKFLF